MLQFPCSLKPLGGALYFHCIHVCCDENASGHHHYNKMQLSDGNYSSRRVILSVQRIERIGRINKLVRVIVINEVQFSDGEHNNYVRSSIIFSE